ncbi:MAG: hypothetical protein QXP81_10740 [Nitrososphaerota archaeon]
MLIFTQSLYSLLSSEVGSRRNFDVDRYSERLKIRIGVGDQPGEPLLLVENSGPISVKVVRVWVIENRTGAPLPADGPCLADQITIDPGQEISIEVGHCIPDDFTGFVLFKVVTSRGRAFTSDLVYIREGRLPSFAFPHTLTVSIVNMRRGRTYTVTVEPVNSGDAEPKRFTHKATASNENVTVAFGTTAGAFKVTLYENGRLVQLGEGRNPVTVSVPDQTSVVFDLGRRSVERVDLQVSLRAVPKTVRLQGGSDDSEIVTLMVYVSLPKGPGKEQEDVTITGFDGSLIGFSGNVNARLLRCETFTGVTLSPGSTQIIALCDVEIQGGRGGGRGQLTISLAAGAVVGQGEVTGMTYTSGPASTTVDVKPGGGDGGGKGGGQ